MSLFFLFPVCEASEQTKGAQRGDQQRGAGLCNGLGKWCFQQELEDDKAEQGRSADDQQQSVHRPASKQHFTI